VTADPAPASRPAGGAGDATEQADEPKSEVQATPAAERRAEELGVDLSQVRGTGSGGRIIVKDVQQAARER
jgi:pyruvate/2-oxoglutarate dehydrogenase complex dihydrolipoamide acyltransferase (E2) component